MKKKYKTEETKAFPISKTKVLRGSRHLVREKVLQILISHYVSKVPIDTLFEHIFFRDFYVDDAVVYENTTSDVKKVYTDEELTDMLSDAAIKWRERDIDFAKSLIWNVQSDYDDILQKISNASENWDIERMSIIDKMIIAMATVEIYHFRDIPNEVAINEAVELSKEYSSEKGPLFINGILDKLKNIYEGK